MNTNTIDKQTRISEAEKFFNLIFGNIHERKFGYLWTKQDKTTYPFAVSSPDERSAMARKAIELNDEGKDVYFGVNLMDEAPARNVRVKAEHVTMQTATVTDIDILGGEHTDPNKYPVDFNTVKSFLPFPVSLTIDSGYGGHGYCIYSEPILITDANRKQATERNKKFISVIRSRAGKFSKAVDGVGDLPRVLRVPGTYNYKLGKENAPLCRLIDVTDIRFTPADMDERLNTLIVTKEKSKTSNQRTMYQSVDDRDRALNMLAVIPVADLSRENWVNVGMALKNNGNNVSEWEQWSRPDERFKDGECETLWQGFSYGGGLTIATIHDIAKRYGYQEPQREHSALMSDDEPQENFIWTQDKIRSCPVNLRLPEGFTFSVKGITQIIETKTKTKYLPVTKTPIVPVKIFYDPIKKIDVYEIAIFSRGKWRHVEVDARTIGDARALNMLCDYGALIIDNVRLKIFLAEIIALNPDMQEIQAYNQTGWTDDNCETFAYPSSDQNIVVRREGYDYERILKPKGNKELWKQKFFEVVEQAGAIGHVIIGGACAACLIRPLGLPNLQIHLEGKKSIGKTPLVQFAVSIFGDPTVRGLTRTFAATPKSRLEFSTAFCDLPFILDELESLGKKKTDELPEDIYNFFLGIGGQALTRKGTKRDEKLFNSTRLTTGEHSIVSHSDNGGVFKRVLNLCCSSLLEERFASDLYSFCRRNNGLFGAEWIKYVTNNKDIIEQQFNRARDAVKANQKKFNKENDDTQLTTLIISLVAYQHFKQCAKMQNLATDADIMNAELTADLVTMLPLLPLAEEINDTTRAIKDLSSYVASHEKTFTRDGKDADTGKPIELGAWGTVCPGKIFDTGAVAFHPTELKRILEDELHYTSADKLIKEWNSQGNILITDKGRATHIIRLGEKTYRTIHFKAGIISTDIDSAEKKYYEELVNS